MISGLGTAAFLERTFHDLHWIGLTPDRVVRYIAKQLYVQPFDYKTLHQKGTALRLVAVAMVADDIGDATRALSEAYQQEQEARFGA